MASFLSDISSSSCKKLHVIQRSDIKDRSEANFNHSGSDELESENEHWKAFFQGSCNVWFDFVKDLTFTSTFCVLTQVEALIIVQHWEILKKLQVTLDVEEATAEVRECEKSKLLVSTVHQLEILVARLSAAIEQEARLSPVGKVFVKLSTRSPKDSKKALAKAHVLYKIRLMALTSQQQQHQQHGVACVDPNTRWKILCEEVANCSAVSTAAEAIELLLDSERVYEDLEFALRGVSTQMTGASAQSARVAVSTEQDEGEEGERRWILDLVARAWDPRLSPASEFRGICWEGKLTCLCQYFHPLLFEELKGNKATIERDILATFGDPRVSAAVAAVGGNCIIDFAWLGHGQGQGQGGRGSGSDQVVIIIELNPFDGVCLGVFPASTGLFLWDNPADRAVMKGEAPFEFRIREELMPPHLLKSQCNKDWMNIIYSSE